MRKDILINVNSENNKVKIDNKTLGITSENLQGKIIFKPEPFVDGVCRLYVDGKGSILMDKQEDCYTVNILSSLLTEDSLDVCFKITEPETEDGIPIFCSKIMHFRVLETIDSSSTIPEDYPSWEQVLDSMMAKVEQMESDAEDRLDEVVGQIQDLTSAYNSNATNKTNEFNANATNKTTAFNQNYASKVTEIDGAVNSAKTELEDYTEGKKDEIDGCIDDLKEELDTYETSKEGELDIYTNSKKTELNTYTNSKKSDLDDYEETKETALNTLAGNLTSAFNSNANSKTSDFNDNATSKTSSFNENATSKTGDFNTNAASKVTDYNTNATTKTSEFNQNASDKTDDFDDNASAKTTAFNNNATAKTAEYDAHVSELQSQVDDLTTLVETELESNSVEGTEIDVSDSAEYRGPVMPGANLEQEQLSGKNLLKNNGADSFSIYGVQYTKNKDKSIKINGTATAQGADYYIFGSANDTGEYLCFPQGTYSISEPATDGSWFYIAREKTLGALFGNTAIKNALANQDCYFYGFFIRVTNGATINNSILYPQIELGSTATDYEEYCGGASPNPDYPQEIEVVTGDNVVKHVGRNLLNTQNFSNNGTGRTNYSTVGDSIAVTALSAGTYRYVYNEIRNLEIGKTYTIKIGDYQDTSNNEVSQFGITNSSGNYYGYVQNLKNTQVLTFVPTENKVIFRCGYLQNACELGDTLTLTNIQLEEGPTATPYEPYRGESFNLDLWKANIFDKNNANIINGAFDAEKINSNVSAKSFYVACNPNTKYKISRNIVGQRFVVATTANTPVVNEPIIDRIINNSGDKVILKTSANAHYIVVYYLYNSSENEELILSSMQVQEAIELCKIGDYEDIPFKNVVGDENYNSSLVEGAWYKKGVIGKDILNGTEDGWEVKDTSQQGKSRWILPIANIKYVSRTNEIGCIIASHYKAIAYAGGSGTYNNVQGISVANNWDRIGIYDNTYNTDLAQFKAWLATHNIELYYALLTPTYTQITNPTLISQLEALKKAKWFKGVNHFWTETANLEPNLKGTYKQSNNLRLQALEQAIVALGGV